MSEQPADTRKAAAGKLTVVGPAAPGRAPEPPRNEAPAGQAVPDTVAETAPGTAVPEAPAKARAAARKPKPRPKPAPRPAPPAPALAEPARPRRRHLWMALSFALLVLAPVAAAGWYLWERAADQYASYLGFTVRTEEAGSAVDILGGLTKLSGGSSDTDILYEFIRSRELVATIDAEVDLRAMFSRPHETDPVFAFQPGSPIEDLVEFWRRMVRVDYASGTQLVEVRVLAFAPRDAQIIAERILDESSRVINELSAIAREDTTRYAREDLEAAVERLKEAREALTSFRSRNQIADLQTDIQAQVGLVSTLQQQLAGALIELDMLGGPAGATDPRAEQVRRRIEVIENRIAQEREKFGAASPAAATDADADSDAGTGEEGYATLIGEFEGLSVDREFAEQTYIAAMAAYDKVRGEALRQSRYLAAYLRPTLAESAEFPHRPMLLGLVALFCLMGWSILTLIFYSLRDRH